MSKSKKRLRDSLNHKQPDKIPVDLGSTSVTGIHVLAIERLRDFYGLEKRPVRLIEPYQMLGEIENDLAEITSPWILTTAILIALRPISIPIAAA